MRSFVSRSGRPAGRSHFRPVLVGLEDRATPATFTVVNTDDSGPGSLRAAIASANATPGADDIDFAPGLTGQTITLTAFDPGLIGVGAFGPSAFVVTSPITIRGSGQTLSRDTGGAAFRLFNVTGTGSLTLDSLTLANGLARGGSGGSGAAGMGGAVFNQGTLVVTNSLLSSNQAVGGDGLAGGQNGGGGVGETVVGPSQQGGGPNGGAVGDPPPPTSQGGPGGFGGGGGGPTGVSDGGNGGAGGFGGGGGGSDGGTGGAGGFGGGGGSGTGGTPGLGGFGGGDGDPNTGSGGGGAGMGGAIFNYRGPLTVTNTTFANNAARGGDGYEGGSAFGAGVFSYDGTTAITNATFAGNTLQAGSGNPPDDAPAGIDLYYREESLSPIPSFALRNTILADGVPGGGPATAAASSTAAAAPSLTGSNNLIRNPDANFALGNLSTADPLLGPLADNGGPVRTIALLPGSPAIDAGTSAGAPATDARGKPRVRGVDVGAFEKSDPDQNAQPTYAVGAGPGGPGAVTVYNPDGSVNKTVNPFGDGTGVRPLTADVNGDGVADTVATTGPGVRVRVAVADGVTGAVTVFDAFEDAFTGGGFVAAADLNGDGTAEIAVSADTTGSARVTVFDGTGTALADFFGIDAPPFRGGARVAFGDVNGDGTPDLIVAAGDGGGPRVAVYDGGTVLGTFGGQPRRLVGDFFAFEDTLRNGAYVTAGDVNGDGYADLIFGGGPGGGPRVRIADGKGLLAAGEFGSLDTPAVAGLTVGNFFAGGSAAADFRQGVVVAAKDLDGDAAADLVTGVPTGSGSTVFTYPGKTLLGTANPPSATAFNVLPDLLTGVFVG